MRAGLLRERVFFQKKQRIQSNSGAQNVVYTTILSTKCNKLKENSISQEVNAKEEFYGSTIRIQVRNNTVISEATNAVFQGTRYRVVLQDINIKDRSIIVHLRKDNE